MKIKMISAIALTLLLCGCGELKVHSNSYNTSEKRTEAPASPEETTAAEAQKPAAETGAAKEEAAEEAAEAPAVTYDAPVAAKNEEQADAPNKDVFAGLYYDDSDSGDMLSIDNINDVLYSVHISRKNDDGTTAEWYFTGEFNGRQVLDYDSCIKSITTVGEDGSVSCEQVYTDGTGYIRISEDGMRTGIVWKDEKDNAGSKDFFIKQ